ncbi:MAG: hypothetical protein LUF92_16015 [Clostridiales bacterium]|nr:hypothetical protein [Clostridiales bacterium]
MNVKDLLAQCDKEELIAAIMDNEGIEEEDREDMHLMYEVFLIKLRDIIPKESGYVLLFMEWSQGDEKWNEAALYLIEEIISDFHRNEEVESLNDDFQLPKEEMNRILSEIHLPVSYC